MIDVPFSGRGQVVHAGAHTGAAGLAEIGVDVQAGVQGDGQVTL
jgi:hypothetical protein